jgi:hypothetical protein
VHGLSLVQKLFLGATIWFALAMMVATWMLTYAAHVTRRAPSRLQLVRPSPRHEPRLLHRNGAVAIVSNTTGQSRPRQIA